MAEPREWTAEDVRRIGALNGITLEPERAERLLSLLRANLAGLAAVPDVDLAEVEPAMTFSLEILAREPAHG
jgi:hypothetical protein